MVRLLKKTIAGVDYYWCPLCESSYIDDPIGAKRCYASCTSQVKATMRECGVSKTGAVRIFKQRIF